MKVGAGPKAPTFAVVSRPCTVSEKCVLIGEAAADSMRRQSRLEMRASWKTYLEDRAGMRRGGRNEADEKGDDWGDELTVKPSVTMRTQGGRQGREVGREDCACGAHQ